MLKLVLRFFVMLPVSFAGYYILVWEYTVGERRILNRSIFCRVFSYIEGLLRLQVYVDYDRRQYRWDDNWFCRRHRQSETWGHIGDTTP